MPAAVRFLVRWPDGQRDRVEADDCGTIVYAQGRVQRYIWRAWLDVRRELEGEGARIQSFAFGELWPAE